MPKSIQAKTILNKKKQRDSWFLDEYTLNPYSGCSFNCLYCYIRGSKYGANMAKSLSVKENAVELLDKELTKCATKKEYGFIVLASATDPYLQFEEELGLTRKLLEVILKHRFPVHIITKSDLVERDFDLLKQIDKQAILPLDLNQNLGRGTLVTFSFSTVDDKVASIFEPGATPPSKRLMVLQKASNSGFKTGVSMMPMIPFISDTGEHLIEMYEAFKSRGAHYVMPATITLFGNGASDSKTLVMRAIAKYYPDLLERYQRYFDNSNELPPFYRKAFDTKILEMSKQYELPNRII